MKFSLVVLSVAWIDSLRRQYKLWQASRARKGK